ncbi:hypothetical protein [Actinomadura craniellae]|nr:hypothetical protein [Actinomadura craniellae]
MTEQQWGLLIPGVMLGGLIVAVVVAELRSKAADRRAEQADRRHPQELRSWAAAHGWDFHEGDVAAAWRGRFADLERFRVNRLVTGSVRGLRVTAADCVHSTEIHESAPDVDGVTVPVHYWLTHRLAVHVAHLPGDWPEVTVAKRLRAETAYGLTGVPEFDRWFHVGTSDPRAARALFSPALVDAHLNGQVPPSWSLRDGELLIEDRRDRLQPQLILPQAEKLRRLAELLGHRT